MSKAKVLDWLNRQKNKAFDIPTDVKSFSPTAKVVYQSLKDVVKQAIKDSEVKKISLFVSDITDDYTITDWASLRSEMGKYISNAVTNGKNVKLYIEYHPELHSSITAKLPFINLKDKFPDCQVSLIKDMGHMKSAIIVESSNKTRHYFTDKDTVLSFSNNWGKNCSHVFVDSNVVKYGEQIEPSYDILSSQVVREGLTGATSFQIKDHYCPVKVD